ncbi:transcription initiation factor IIB [Tulasnella sp. JGI-2019a]|nr:transcription initiation factor IIB [Tulasnella sp. JGI-2019a]
MCELVACSPTVSEIALELFVTSEKERVFGLNAPIDPITAACVLQASRRAIEPVSFEELSSATGVEKHKIGRCHRDLMRHFQRQIAVDDTFNASHTIQGPSEPLELRFIRQYARMLGFSARVTTLATGIGQVAHTETVRAPSDVAASTVLFVAAVAGENKAVDDVSTISGTSTKQLRLGFKKLRSVEGLVHEGFVDAVVSIFGIDRQAACKMLYPKQCD